ncbi:SRPBCC domain-containing protein [Micromonospora coerulea]|uniref:SRPBCC domain-containing protein n=1 Tax=Micromonospora coerulea TaxID=47856 RepID=UPI003D15E38B
MRTTPEWLWRALTEPEFTRRYWGGVTLVSGWRPGSPLLWQDAPDTEAKGLGQRLLAAEPYPPALLQLARLPAGARCTGRSAVYSTAAAAGRSCSPASRHCWRRASRCRNRSLPPRPAADGRGSLPGPVGVIRTHRSYGEVGDRQAPFGAGRARRKGRDGKSGRAALGSLEAPRRQVMRPVAAAPGGGVGGGADGRQAGRPQ